MASTYSTSLQIQLIASGEQSGIWGNTTNTNWNLIEQAVAGVASITMLNANYTLTVLNGVSDEARNMVLFVSGTNSAVRQIVAPLVPKIYVVYNNTSGGYAITIGGATGTLATIPASSSTIVFCDGTNFYSGISAASGNFSIAGNATVAGNLSVTGTTTLTGAATAPTPTTGDNTTKIATTAFVTTAVSTATGSLGTMSTQNANAVAITGGTINGTTVGASTASTGAFTTLSANSTTTLSGTTSITGNLSASTLITAGEKTTVSATAASGTINYDILTQGILYYTSNASGTWVLNVRGNSSTSLDSIMAVGETRTITFLATQGSTPYYQTSLTIDSSSVTPKWLNGVTPTAGNASGIDTYVLSIIKTGSGAFTVIESLTQYK